MQHKGCSCCHLSGTTTAPLLPHSQSNKRPCVDGDFRAKPATAGIEICPLTCYTCPGSSLRTWFNLECRLFKVCRRFPSEQWTAAAMCHGSDLWDIDSHTHTHTPWREQDGGVCYCKHISVPEEATLSTYIAIKPRTQWTSSSVKSARRSYKRIYGLCNAVWKAL